MRTKARFGVVVILLLCGASFGQAPAGGVPPDPIGPMRTTITTDGGVTESDPDAPTVGASLDRTEAFVGDKLTLTVSAVGRAGIVVSLPAKLELGKLELLSREGEDKGRDLGDGRRSYRFLLGVAAYEVGDLEIPSLPLTYLTLRGDVRTIHTAPLNVHIRSLVSPESDQKLETQPPRPPRSALVEDKRVMRAAKIGGAVLGAGVLLLAIGLLVRRSLKKRQAIEAAVIPSRAPDEVAVERLRALRDAGNFSVEGYRPFYFAVAEVVRAYLGARYGFDSLELTTTELLDELGRHAPQLVSTGAMSKDSDGEATRFLESSDMVKFAKAGSTDGDALAALDSALAIVLSTAKPLQSAAAQVAVGPVLQPRPLDADADGEKTRR